MKTVYGHLCDECQSVRACSQFGCRPMVTQDGGATIECGLPISMHDTEGTLAEPIRRVNAIASLSWLGVATAVIAGLALAGYCVWLS